MRMGRGQPAELPSALPAGFEPSPSHEVFGDVKGKAKGKAPRRTRVRWADDLEDVQVIPRLPPARQREENPYLQRRPDPTPEEEARDAAEIARIEAQEAEEARARAEIGQNDEPQVAEAAEDSPPGSPASPGGGSSPSSGGSPGTRAAKRARQKARKRQQQHEAAASGSGAGRAEEASEAALPHEVAHNLSLGGGSGDTVPVVRGGGDVEAALEGLNELLTLNELTSPTPGTARPEPLNSRPDGGSGKGGRQRRKTIAQYQKERDAVASVAGGLAATRQAVHSKVAEAMALRFNIASKLAAGAQNKVNAYIQDPKAWARGMRGDSGAGGDEEDVLEECEREVKVAMRSFEELKQEGALGASCFLLGQIAALKGERDAARPLLERALGLDAFVRADPEAADRAKQLLGRLMPLGSSIAAEGVASRTIPGVHRESLTPRSPVVAQSTPSPPPRKSPTEGSWAQPRTKVEPPTPHPRTRPLIQEIDNGEDNDKEEAAPGKRVLIEEVEHNEEKEDFPDAYALLDELD